MDDCPNCHSTAITISKTRNATEFTCHSCLSEWIRYDEVTPTSIPTTMELDKKLSELEERIFIRFTEYINEKIDSIIKGSKHG